MARHPLTSSLVKINRAKEHFNNLNAAITAFKARKTYDILLDEQSEPAVKIYRFREIEKVPTSWGGIIGDVVHNCVGALDSLATSLVLKSGYDSEDIIRNTYFPIHESYEGFSKGKTKAFFERVGPDVEKIVRALHAYRRGKGDALWRLHRLDIIDKHRTIVAAGVGVADATFEWPVDPRVGKLPDKTIDVPSPPFPLKDGDEIVRTAFFEDHFNAKAYFLVDIAFAETNVIDGDPVMPRLRHFVELADGIVQLFDRKFFK